MSLKARAVEEFNRGPITVTTAVICLFIAAASLLIAWLQYIGAPAFPASNSTVMPATLNLQLTNLLLVTAFFLACSFSLASLIGILERSYPFHAMVLSVPIAVLSAFFSLLVFQLIPPRPLTDQLIQVASDVAFWGTSFIFVAVNGHATASSIFNDRSYNESQDKNSSGDTGAGGQLFALLMMLVIWGALVSVGLSKLVQLFLR